MKKNMACLFALLLTGALFLTPIQTALAWNGSWKTGSDSGFQFCRFDGEYYPGDGKVYFMGGRLYDGSTDGSVWSYDPTTGVYSDTGVDLVTPISNYTMNLLQDADGKWGFYVFCGRLAAGGTTNAVQVYYPDTNTAIQLPPIDDYPGITTCTSAMNVVYNNRMYMAGGFDPAGTPANPDQSGYFDPKNASGSRWIYLTTISTPRAYIMGAVVNDKIYAIGGSWYDGSGLVNVTTVQVMDPNAVSPVWDDASVADLPEACSSSRAFGFDDDSPYKDPHVPPLAGKIVSGCGFWPDENARVYVYDVSSDTWEAFPSLQLDRREQAAAFIPPQASSQRPMSGMCMWGGRKDSDANLLATPECYGVDFSWPMFLPAITNQTSP